MISSAEILTSLQSAVNRFSSVARTWHFLAIPLLSVAVIAWLSGNPFNGLAFTAVSALFAFFALRTPGNMTLGSDAVTITLIILGVFYGLFGMLKLAVHIDAVLFIGSLTLLTKFLVNS